MSTTPVSSVDGSTVSATAALPNHPTPTAAAAAADASPQKPPGAVTLAKPDSRVCGHIAAQSLEGHNHSAPLTLSPRTTQTSQHLRHDNDTASPLPINPKRDGANSNAERPNTLSLMFPMMQPEPCFTTFPPIAAVVQNGLVQITATEPHPRTLPPPPAALEDYDDIPGSISLFLSTAAEQYWAAFGPTDPAVVGHVLLRSEASSKWLTICFAVAHPYAYELMCQLDVLAAEITRVFCCSYPSYKSVFKPDYRSTASYLSKWQGQFDCFIDEWQSPTWDGRVDRLYLLNDEYQAITDKLYDHWKSLQFVPRQIWEKLNRLDKLREVLQRNIPEMPEKVEHAKSMRKQVEQRSEEREAEEARLAMMNTPTSAKPTLWNCCVGRRSKKQHQHSRTAQSLAMHLYNNLIIQKEDCLLFFRSLGHIRTYGTQRAAYVIVSCLSALATAAMAMSVWRCPPTAALAISVTIDSNFWSTCSQMFTGLGGLYCLIIPILQHTDLDVSTPQVFKALLALSFIAAVVAVVVYHFQTQVSLIVALVSGLAGLLATLMVIKDAGNKINLQKNTISDQEMEITRLRNR